MNDPQQKIDWQRILDELAEEVPAARFDAWIRPVRAAVEGRTMILSVPSRFFLDNLRDHHEKAIRKKVQQHFGEDVLIEFGVNPDLAVEQPQPGKTGEVTTGQVDGFIDHRFTFANFVVGPSNEFCHAACRAVADLPGSIYNPLYIYGGVGLGKTHLINAVANELLNQNHFKIAYRTSERFTNELISAIRNGTTQQFRDRYRQVDVLIVDDVQFIAGKASTQEEFFHTFNALYEVRKQIILTSDRPPREMNHLQERLKSRFGCGLVADIQPPSLETRQAILNSKAELAGIELPADVTALLASRITSNVRELEGALTRLTAHATLTGRTIDMDFSRRVLRDLLHEEVRAVTVEDIQKQVANYYNIRLQDMRSKKRTRNVAFPRQVAMYCCKQLTSLSLPEIGEAFGGRDHTTVLYAVRKINEMMQGNESLEVEVERMMQMLRN
ncbi:MAG: chromosomal replication initiator protein DnaA [Zetaproteobacteria bacterium CG06_land_8_20_14_3_00_59_53]|nr:MAG: chromosomal replication initiation protein DnaA [Zetaproteobacteria bacterium CG2_30_59_37]PIO88798.1 MAG: chromosomal replication initiator protein DnaA [Zetaproteobacteria bacterium CG23_combo_of_CG06-09_8_20_14_all_59_86]PIU70029.1 MAG: chromosomal replication initiator protein DnaA [Zetaproteobacteria bacterium CG06_land_8_20_14_3_00_59_53]PIU97986.1 MAG: chromosomal replication initiator protein DnaA [Zetaproteobacteria bacterium CG03_land_8_20_14_0_80_59_51]PIY47002.1 MAG: chromos